MVVEVEAAPHAELGGGLHHRVLDLVLVLLVGGLELLQLLLDALVVVEVDARHDAEQRAFFLADLLAVEDINLSLALVGGPEAFGVGHVADEVVQALVVLALDVVDEHQVEHHAVHLIVFEGAEHLLGEAGAVDVVDLHEHDGMVAADAEAPEAALREGVLG